MINQSDILELAKTLGKILLERKLYCAVAESCTGGGLAEAITAIPGSSQWFDRAFITYTNVAKEEMLAVPHETLLEKGAVSSETACAMANGVIANSDAYVSVAITGVAGPGGGSSDKPVGTVWIAWAGDLRPTSSQCFIFKGDRAQIRLQAIQTALQGLIKRCDVKDKGQRQYKGPDRYFIALWPDKKTSQALYEQALNFIASTECRVSAKENLHLTLIYFGQVSPDFVKRARDVIDNHHLASFKLRFTRANHWQHSDIAWLGLDKIPGKLEMLVRSLNKALIPTGFKPEKGEFVPHVTIARQLTKKTITCSIETVTWMVNDLCLIKSTPSSHHSHYEIINRWSVK